MLGGWDAKAVERCWDKRSKMSEPEAANDNVFKEWMENWNDAED